MAAQSASSKHLRPFNTGDVRILLLENVNQTAQDMLKRQGYQVEFYKSSLPEEELIEKIRYGTLFPAAEINCRHIFFFSHLACPTKNTPYNPCLLWCFLAKLASMR
jgi:hypothetical protein